MEHSSGDEDPGTTREHTRPASGHPPMRVSRGITWIVGLSPVAVIPGAALALFAMIKDGRGWIGILPASPSAAF